MIIKVLNTKYFNIFNRFTSFSTLSLLLIKISFQIMYNMKEQTTNFEYNETTITLCLILFYFYFVLYRTIRRKGVVSLQLHLLCAR